MERERKEEMEGGTKAREVIILFKERQQLLSSTSSTSFNNIFTYLSVCAFICVCMHKYMCSCMSCVQELTEARSRIWVPWNWN